MKKAVAKVVPLDRDAAAEIGALYTKSIKSLVEAVNGRLECGQRLNEVKATLAHGDLEPWLERNKEALGFTRSTAFRLMKAAGKVAPARLSNEADALQLSRSLWGHEPSPKGRSALPSRKPKQWEEDDDSEDVTSPGHLPNSARVRGLLHRGRIERDGRGGQHGGR